MAAQSSKQEKPYNSYGLCVFIAALITGMLIFRYTQETSECVCVCVCVVCVFVLVCRVYLFVCLFVCLPSTKHKFKDFMNIRMISISRSFKTITGS